MARLNRIAQPGAEIGSHQLRAKPPSRKDDKLHTESDSGLFSGRNEFSNSELLRARALRILVERSVGCCSAPSVGAKSDSYCLAGPKAAGTPTDDGRLPNSYHSKRLDPSSHSKIIPASHSLYSRSRNLKHSNNAVFPVSAVFGSYFHLGERWA